MQRRIFLKQGAFALVTMGLSPTFLRRTVMGMELPNVAKGKILVCLFQRGAADALNVVVPYGEPEYYKIRPRIAIPQPIKPGNLAPTSGANLAAIDLDGFFGLHPSLAPLAPLYKRGILAPIHAVGSPSSTRSHFDAQDYMESGTPDNKGTPDGWLNRYLATCGTCEAHHTSPFRGVAFAPQSPRIMQGPQETVVMNAIDEFTVRAAGSQVERLEALYRTGSTDLVHGAGQEMFDAVKMLKDANPQKYTPQNGAVYGNTQFSLRLKQIAQLIRSNVGLEVAFADIGGWDTHQNQGNTTGQLAQRMNEFAPAIAAFVADMGDRMEDIVILTMSEFGRTAHENGNGGTDHGHAGAMFVVGGNVKGGKVYGKWPGLAREQLYEGRDLALTTDFRAVFSEVATKHLGASSPEKLFPGFKPGSTLGIL